MRYKKKLIILLILVGIVTAIQYALPYSSSLVFYYDKYIFHPFQSFRNILLRVVPFSVGDILYLLGGACLVYVIGKCLYYAARYKKYKHNLVHSLLHTLMVVCVCYIVFFLGWGGNYYKKPLADFWNVDKARQEQDTSLERFDRFLVDKLNGYVQLYRPASFAEIDKRAQNYYKQYTDSRTRMHGLNAKSSLFGTFMQYFGIQGYYNPFTGEAQVNKHLPAFMLPFVVCHEMAHQSGIAAEDDANLLAYTLGVRTKDPLFKYSAYLNLWLYTNARVSMIDTAKARNFRRMLNPVTISHLDTLKKMRQRYNSDVSVYSGQLYDGYLKLHHQKDGIESYNKVAISAWAWEQQYNSRNKGLIRLP